MDEIPKPRELLSIRSATADLFVLLRRWFAVPTSVTLDLRTVDSAVTELGEPRLVIAMAMRKLQALHLLTTPGVVTTTDAVLTVIQDLERALLQAPAMHLRDTAAVTDWDAALAALGGDAADAVLPARDDEDDEITLFRTHHAALHAAARAVLAASDGRICRLV